MLEHVLMLSGLVLAILYLLWEWWENVWVESIRNQEETGLDLKEQWLEKLHGL